MQPYPCWHYVEGLAEAGGDGPEGKAAGGVEGSYTPSEGGYLSEEVLGTLCRGAFHIGIPMTMEENAW